MGCAFALHGQSFQKLWSQTIKHFFLYLFFSLLFRKNDVAPSQSLSTNLTQPKLTFPPTNKLCPQLNSNHLPQGCQPCMLPLSHTLPSEKTTILAYKYQRYIILLATRKHQLYSRLKILEFFKTSYGMEAVTQPLSVISSQSLGSINYILGYIYYTSYT